jgi:drug/metabolite transporter (DMT)-like permease
MTTATVKTANLTGAGYALAAVTCFSVTDVGIKFLSGGYALHQVVFIRALVALVVFAVLVMPFAGGLGVLRTRRPVIHIVRGLCVVAANMCLFLGLAALPLAEATAIFFVSPLIITVFSVIFLHETVGPRRWAAIAVGFVGVLVIVKPGTAAFQVASLLPIAAAFLYATLHMLTRRIGGTESAATMAAYIQITFLVASVLIGMAIGDGRFAGSGHPSLEFLLRGWVWPATGDYALFAMLGVAGLFGGLCISQAYRLSEAAFAAPFEYAAMPMAIFWGGTVFGTWPDATAWIGIALIIGSGLYLLWRETRRDATVTTKPPKHRR